MVLQISGRTKSAIRVHSCSARNQGAPTSSERLHARQRRAYAQLIVIRMHAVRSHSSPLPSVLRPRHSSPPAQPPSPAPPPAPRRSARRTPWRGARNSPQASTRTAPAPAPRLPLSCRPAASGSRPGCACGPRSDSCAPQRLPRTRRLPPLPGRIASERAVR